MFANLRVRAPGLSKWPGLLSLGVHIGDSASAPAGRTGPQPEERVARAASASLAYVCAHAGRLAAFVHACARRDAERWALRRMDFRSQRDIGTWRIADEVKNPWWRE